MHHYRVESPTGKFYIGRHSTKKLENDNYMGSGKWIRSIKDKTNLRKTILFFRNTFEDLLIEEKRMIEIHIKDEFQFEFVWIF